ncbi:hypothetical protein LEMLEM_LOCUS12829 [Lemmus lemmus]
MRSPTNVLDVRRVSVRAPLFFSTRRSIRGRSPINVPIVGRVSSRART